MRIIKHMINEEQYEKLSAPFRSEKWINLLNLLNQVTKYLMYFGYFFLVYLSIHKGLVIKTILIPGIGFILVTIFRKLYSAPRHYEVLNIKPLIHKDTVGKSFPSRHCFSATIISMTACYVIGVYGIFFWIDTLLIYGLRIIGGIHFPKDVLGGCMIGIVLGTLFWIL